MIDLKYWLCKTCAKELSNEKDCFKHAKLKGSHHEFIQTTFKKEDVYFEA